MKYTALAEALWASDPTKVVTPSGNEKMLLDDVGTLKAIRFDDVKAYCSAGGAWIYKTGDFTAAAGQKYLVDAGFAVTLPDDGVDGQVFEIIAIGGEVAVNTMGTLFAGDHWTVQFQTAWQKINVPDFEYVGPWTPNTGTGDSSVAVPDYPGGGALAALDASADAQIQLLTKKYLALEELVSNHQIQTY